MCQNQVRPADGMGQLQQTSDLPTGCGLLRCRELGWVTRYPQDVESAQIVNVRLDTVEYLVVAHVLQGWPHWVRVISCAFPCCGRSQIMVSLATQPGMPFAIFLCHQVSKFVSNHWACCQAFLQRASSVGCSSSKDDSSDSLEGVSSLGLVWCCFCWADWIFSS